MGTMKAQVKKTTKYEKENEKTIFVLECWTLRGIEFIKHYPYVGDSFDSAGNLFDHYKKNESDKGDIVCLRIVQLVLTEFLQTIKVEEIGVWIATSAEYAKKYNDKVAAFLETMKEVPFDYSLVRKE